MSKVEEVYFWNENCTHCGTSHAEKKTRYEGCTTFSCLDCDIRREETWLAQLKSWKGQVS